jgi:hypothetical protein
MASIVPSPVVAILPCWSVKLPFCGQDVPHHFSFPFCSCTTHHLDRAAIHHRSSPLQPPFLFSSADIVEPRASMQYSCLSAVGRRPAGPWRY